MESALAFRNSERLSAVGNHELTSMKDLPDGDKPKRVDPPSAAGVGRGHRRIQQAASVNQVRLNKNISARVITKQTINCKSKNKQGAKVPAAFERTIEQMCFH